MRRYCDIVASLSKLSADEQSPRKVTLMANLSARLVLAAAVTADGRD
jgi:hypothetical protein